MTRASRKNRRRKMAGIAADPMALAPIPKREKQRRDGNGRFARPQEDPMRVTLDRRCRRFGLAASEGNREICRSPWMCCDLGFVIEARTSGRDHMRQKSRLWDVFTRWCRAETAYRTRYLGQSETPANAALLMVPDVMETDQSATVDVRTPDDRDRDAVNGWMRWQGYLGRLSAEHRKILHHARRDDGPALWRDGLPTPSGVMALAALRDLVDVTEGD